MGYLDYIQRKKELQKLEEERARKDGREARKISFKKLPEGKRGYYDHKNPNKITINKDTVKQDYYQSMRTVIHEGRHAYQDDIVKGRIEPKEADRGKINNWKHNSREMGGYYFKYQESPLRYRFQPKEDDANNFANEKMNSFSERFKSDPKYQKHMAYYAIRDKSESRQARFQICENYREKIAEEVKIIYQKSQQILKSQQPYSINDQQQNTNNKPTTTQEPGKPSPAVQRYREKEAARQEAIKTHRAAQENTQDLTQGRGK